MKSIHLDAIRAFEGYSAVAKWDYKQASNGYGTRARSVGEVIDRVEAERRFQQEIGEARALVLRFAPELDEGTMAALTSLTFNAGTAWMRAGLGQAISAGDIANAQAIFKQYTHAGGKSLPGLVARREAEARWFGQENAGSAPAAIVPTGTKADPVTTTPSREKHVSVAAAPSKASLELETSESASRTASAPRRDAPSSTASGPSPIEFHVLITALLAFSSRPTTVWAQSRSHPSSGGTNAADDDFTT